MDHGMQCTSNLLRARETDLERTYLSVARVLRMWGETYLSHKNHSVLFQGGRLAYEKDDIIKKSPLSKLTKSCHQSLTIVEMSVKTL